MAEASVGISVSVSGLGKGLEVKDFFTDPIEPNTALHVVQQVQETADEPEALNIGVISDIKGILIRAIDGDINIDTSFESSFNAELLVREGTSQFFCPAVIDEVQGTVYFGNAVAEETVTLEAVIYGKQV